MENKTTKNKYIMYCRKSTEDKDKQIQSIPDQKKENGKLADQLKIEIVKTFSECKSAKQPGREQFNEMVRLLNESVDIKV